MKTVLVLASLIGLVAAPAVQAQTFGPAFAAWIASAENVISGVKVDTRQHGVSANQTSVAAAASNKALANVIVQTDTNAAVAKAVMAAESMQTGVAGLCANTAMAEGAASASDSNEAVRDALTAFEADWAQNGGSRPEMMAATQAIRRGVMCTEAELAKGFCEPGADQMTGVVPAGDTNAQAWLLRRSYGTQEAETGAIYVDTLAPLPSLDPVVLGTASVDELLRHAEQRRQLALISMARGAIMDVVLGGLEGPMP